MEHAGYVRGEAKKRGKKKHKADERGYEARVNSGEDGESCDEKNGAGNPGTQEMGGRPYRDEAEIGDIAGVEKMLHAERDQGNADEKAAEPDESGGGLARSGFGEQKGAGVRGGLENAATPAGRQ